jgi:hypothetical protein
MRARTLGRWTGNLVAVAALGLGATVGASAAGAADLATSNHFTLAEGAAESTPSGDASADGFEWQ